MGRRPSSSTRVAASGNACTSAWQISDADFGSRRPNAPADAATCSGNPLFRAYIAAAAGFALSMSSTHSTLPRVHARCSGVRPSLFASKTAFGCSFKISFTTVTGK